MSAAPTPPPHTPVNFVKAGNMNNFSDNCVALLAKAGYSPDDFGTYDEVREKIKEAKAERRKYEASVPKGQPKDPNKPDPRTAMLARSQSGHLSQDAMFRGPGRRGDACGNHRPPGPGESRGYNTFDAPCMPMQSHGGTETRPRNVVGSPHWAVSQNEAEQRVPGTTVQSTDQPNPPGDQMSAQAKRNVGIVTGDNDQGDYDRHMAAGFDKTKKVSAKARTGEAQRRQAVAATGQQAAAAQLEDKGSSAAASGKGDVIDGETAADCINNYRKKAMEKMRQKSIDKYGKDFDATKQKAEADLKAAQDAKASPPLSLSFKDHAAQLKAEGHPSPYAEAGRQRAEAREKLERAESEMAGLECMNKDVFNLCNPPPSPPSQPQVGPNDKAPGQFTPPNPLPAMPPFTGAYPPTPPPAPPAPPSATS